MSCESYEIMMLERQAGELSPESATALTGHLAGCADCTRFARELGALAPERLREELAPADPGEAFFVRTRNEVWHAVESARAAERLPAPPEPAGLWARLGWAARRLGEALFLHRHHLATGVATAAAVAVLTVALWPREVRPPSLFLPSEVSAPTVSGLDAPPSDELGEGDVLADVGSLSQEEMQILSTKLTLETSAEVGTTDVDEDPEGVEGQIESLSPEELKALDVQLSAAAREAKGA